MTFNPRAIFTMLTWVFSSNGSTWNLTAPASVTATLTQNNTQTWTISFQNGEKRVFSYTSGSLTSIADPNGNTTSLSYDGSNRLATVTDPASRTLTFTYGGSFTNLVTSITSSVGISLSYAYDTQQRLTQVTKPDQTTLSFTYNAQSLITAVTDSQGKTLESHTYDTNALGISNVEFNDDTTTMSDIVHQLLVASLLLAATTLGTETPTKSLLEVEKPGIDKIAQLTAKEHSAILFAIADQLIGYAKDGHIEWIKSNHNPRRVTCAWPHPALSHAGLRVAFVSDSDEPKHCRIVVRDIPTGVQRELIETADDPGEISWSWDDTEIAFLDHGISAVSVKDGVKRVILTSSMRKIGDQEFTFGVWYPMQWLHNNEDLVVELNTEIPTKEPGTYKQQSNLLLVSGGGARVIDIGSQPAVSPKSDRIAYYAPEGILATNVDATGKTVLTKAPGVVFFKDELFWKIVWSPDGNRLFFGTIVSENRRDNLYLLDVKSGHREQFLSHTSITIRSWQ